MKAKLQIVYSERWMPTEDYDMVRVEIRRYVSAHDTDTVIQTVVVMDGEEQVSTKQALKGYHTDAQLQRLGIKMFEEFKQAHPAWHIQQQAKAAV